MFGLLDGKEMAFARVELYGPDSTTAESGWYEGLRVHPESRGAGFARSILPQLIAR